METDKPDMTVILNMFAQINATLQTMDSKLEKLILENEHIKEENKNLKETLEKQDRKIASLERETKKKNLIIKGVIEKENESREETLQTTIGIVEKLGVKINKEMEVDEVRRIGRYNTKGERPILLKLTTGNKKAEILSKSVGLKGSNIWIDEDYTKETLEDRRTLMPQLKEARRQGHKAHLKFNKLIIDNEVYEAKDFTATNIDAENKKEQEQAGIKRTTSERSPTGNFAQGKIKITKNY
jgi:hypothetical protein